jgi:hypothetical protein
VVTASGRGWFRGRAHDRGDEHGCPPPTEPGRSSTIQHRRGPGVE